MAVHQPECHDHDRAGAGHRDGVCMQNPLWNQFRGHAGAVSARGPSEHRNHYEHLRGGLHHGGHVHSGGEGEPYAAGADDIFDYGDAVFYRQYPVSLCDADGGELHRALHQRDSHGHRPLDSLFLCEHGGLPHQLRAGDDRGNLRQEPDERQSDLLSLPDGVHDGADIREHVGGAPQNLGIPVHRGHDGDDGMPGGRGDICDVAFGHGGAVRGAADQRSGIFGAL